MNIDRLYDIEYAIIQADRMLAGTSDCGENCHETCLHAVISSLLTEVKRLRLALSSAVEPVKQHSRPYSIETIDNNCVIKVKQ